MPGRFWKWRMEGSAIYVSEQMNAITDLPDIVICSSMMDLGFLKALLDNRWMNTPIIYYMHENQLTYPRSPLDLESGKTDLHYGFINLKSCLVADSILFNSEYHRINFIEAAVNLMDRLPDFQFQKLKPTLLKKSSVLQIGIDFKAIDQIKSGDNTFPKLPVLLWNHRWEFDKRPDTFIRLCKDLMCQNMDFEVMFLGQNHQNIPDFIESFINNNQSLFIYAGYAPGYEEYIQMLKSADILPVCSDHDYYGISVIEALYCGLEPILPIDMVYHEHLPRSSQYDQCFYRGYDELLTKTIKSINGLTNYSYEPVKQHLTLKYNIDYLINKFNRYIEKKVHENQAP